MINKCNESKGSTRLPQGSCKYGFYEVFKVVYSSWLGEEETYQHRTQLYLAAAATAEFLADIALSPLEACKVSTLIGRDHRTLRSDWLDHCWISSPLTVTRSECRQRLSGSSPPP